jgi:hypothetical protein
MRRRLMHCGGLGKPLPRRGGRSYIIPDTPGKQTTQTIGRAPLEIVVYEKCCRIVDES